MKRDGSNFFFLIDKKWKMKAIIENVLKANIGFNECTPKNPL